MNLQEVVNVVRTQQALEHLHTIFHIKDLNGLAIDNAFWFSAIQATQQRHAHFFGRHVAGTSDLPNFHGALERLAGVRTASSAADRSRTS